MVYYNVLGVKPCFDDVPAEYVIEDYLPDSEINNGYGLSDFWAISIDGIELDACVYRFDANEHEIQQTKRRVTFARSWLYEGSVIWIPERLGTIPCVFRFDVEEYSGCLQGDPRNLPILSNSDLGNELGKRWHEISDAEGCGSIPLRIADWSSQKLIQLIAEGMATDSSFKIWPAMESKLVCEFTIQYTIGASNSIQETTVKVVSYSGMFGLDLRETHESDEASKIVGHFSVLSTPQFSKRIRSYLSENGVT